MRWLVLQRRSLREAGQVLRKVSGTVGGGVNLTFMGEGYPFDEIFQAKTDLHLRGEQRVEPGEMDTVQSSCISRRTRG